MFKTETHFPEKMLIILNIRNSKTQCDQQETTPQILDCASETEVRQWKLFLGLSQSLWPVRNFGSLDWLGIEFGQYDNITLGPINDLNHLLMSRLRVTTKTMQNHTEIGKQIKVWLSESSRCSWMVYPLSIKHRHGTLTIAKKTWLHTWYIYIYTHIHIRILLLNSKCF